MTWLSRTVRGDGIELAVYEQGDPARPTVLLVHGYPDTHLVWHAVAGILSQRFHVVAYDVRGAGDSQIPSHQRQYRLRHLAADLFAVAEAVSPGEPVHVIGHDWGSIQAWEAVTEPGAEERIAGFTSVSGPSLDQLSHWMRHCLARPTPRRLAALFGQLRRSWYIAAFHVPGLAELVWRRFQAIQRSRWQHDPERRDEYPAHSLDRDGRGGMRLYRANFVSRLLRPRSRTTIVPVQLIVAERDRFVRPATLATVQRWAPRLWRRTIDAGHWAPLSQPETLAAHVGGFVDHLEGRAGAMPPQSRVQWPTAGRAATANAGKLVVVTGAGSGIGRGISLAFAASGARVIAADIDPIAAELTAEIITGAGGTAESFEVDVSDATAMDTFAARVAVRHRVPDIVVNNAGVGLSGPFLQTSMTQWHRLFDINVWGVIHGCRSFGTLMAEHGTGGHLVNMASAAAFLPSKIMPGYATSKAAVLMLSECLRADLADTGIRVTAVCPGFVNTNLSRTATFAGLDSDAQQAMRRNVTGMYSSRGFGVEKVARAVLRGVRRNRPLVTVTVEATTGRWLSRLAPTVVRAAARVDLIRRSRP